MGSEPGAVPRNLGTRSVGCRYTYEVAPVFTLMEQVVLGEMCRIVGFENGDGVFCPGEATDTSPLVFLPTKGVLPKFAKSLKHVLFSIFFTIFLHIIMCKHLVVLHCTHL